MRAAEFRVLISGTTELGLDLDGSELSVYQHLEGRLPVRIPKLCTPPGEGKSNPELSKSV